MRLKDLQKIYPEAEWQTYSTTDPAYLSIPDMKGYLWIPTKNLSKKEIALLKLSAEDTVFPDSNDHNLWYQILFQQKSMELTGVYRVLQLQLQFPKDFLTEVWREHIDGIFPNAEELLFLTPQSVLLIEKQSNYALTKEELEGIFLTLDDDFGTVSHVFIGRFHKSSPQFPLLFEEEQDIFREEAHLVKHRKVIDIADVALHYFTKDALSKSLLTHSMKEEWQIDEEMKEIIHALWNNQGNISSTAKELFMHRNTLQYRLEKFQENTGLQLKNTDDLILCFLLLSE